MSDQEKNPVKKIDELLNDVGKLSEFKDEETQTENINEAESKSVGEEQEKDPASENTDKEPEDIPVTGNEDEAEEVDTEQKSKRGKKIAAIVAAVFVVLAGIYAVLSMPLSDAKKEEIYANKTFIQGVSVFDVDVSGETVESARQKLSGKVDFSGEEVLLELKMKDTIIPVKAADLQVGNTIDSVLKEAMLYGRDGHLLKRLMDTMNAKNKGKNFDVAIYTDDTSLQNLVNTIITNYSVEAKDADIQINTTGDEKFTFIPEQVGMQISPDGLAEKIKTHIETKATGYVELTYTETQPKITEAQLRENMVLRATYSTTVTGATGRRKNIVLAATKINGGKIMPGETHNIENLLGPRNKANGWSVGGEFVNGELVNGYGGGICQASTTLFNAVIRADLEIVERSNHSQTVGYVPLGFDATISSGGPYFIWKNNTDYPIFVFASATMNKITVELYGAPLPYGENITYEEVVSARGTVTSGRRVQSALVFKKDGTEVHRISWSSSYRGKPVKVTTTTSKATTTAATTAATTKPTTKPSSTTTTTKSSSTATTTKQTTKPAESEATKDTTP